MKPWFRWRRSQPKVIMGEKLFEQDAERTAWYRRMTEAWERQSAEPNERLPVCCPDRLHQLSDD